MDTQEVVTELREVVQRARGLPMSASCVVNRVEVLDRLDELERQLPEELERARTLLANRDAIIDAAHAEAARIVEAGSRERAELVRHTDLHAEAEAAADRLLQESRQEAAELRRETDDYVDHKLASLEVALNKTLQTIEQGRDKLRERGVAGLAPLLQVSDDPARARRELDAWLSAKLARFEGALHKTLETVVRGRERLCERSHLDDYVEAVDTGDVPASGDVTLGYAEVER